MDINLQQLNDFEGFFQFKHNWAFKQFVNLKHKIMLLIYGNQAGKTGGAAYQYVLRILGLHPVPSKNVVYFECKNGHEYGPANFDPTLPCKECGCKVRQHKRGSRVFRFCSVTLPGQSSSLEVDGSVSEVKNTQYPEFRKWLPKSLIKKDITVRNPAIIVKDPYGGKDIIIEFISYNQSTASTAGVQRMSIWLDESPDISFYEEQLPRLLAENGDLIITYTPVDRSCFDEETEIVTKRGWKKYNEILMQDELLSYNISKDCYEWSDIRGFYLDDYKGKMVHIENKRFDFLVTPEHKWVVCNDRRGNEKYLEKSENLNTKHIIKRSSTFKNTNENSNFSDELISLAGWIVTDGTVHKEGNSYSLSITQSRSANELHCVAIEKLLSNFAQDNWSSKVYNYKPRIIDGKIWDGDGQVQVFHIYRELRKDLLKVLDGKSLKQDWICSLSNRQLNILYEAIVDGDGHRKENGAVELKQVNNEKLIDAFHLICTLIGKFADKRKRSYWRKGEQIGVNVFADSKRYDSNSHIKSCKVNKEYDYEGKVWCPTTKNGTVVARRNGHVSISGNSWLFDELYDKASIIYRSKYICDYLSTPKLKVNPIEKQGSPYDIAVVMAATDDNPTLDTALIDALFRHIDDPDVVAIRRYGIFKQLSGRIFKDFEYATHAIPEDSLADGIPKDWTHAQGIDFHPQTPWAVAFMSMSPTNEVFVWGEWNPSPEKYTTKEISRHVATLGKGYKFRLSLIDPFAQATKKDNVTVLDDINEEFLQCKKEEICTTSFWQPWDTKGERGRDAIRERLKNSLEVKKPFNNKVVRNGRTVYLPTIWVMNNCKNVLKSMKNWRWEEWGNIGANANKDAKNKPEQKWSHFNMVLEAVFKEPAFKPSMTLHTSNQVADYYKIR